MRGSVRSFAICSQLPLFSGEWKDCEELRPKPKENWSFVDKRREGMKQRTVWRAEANQYRCMRCGKGSKYMKMPGSCD